MKHQSYSAGAVLTAVNKFFTTEMDHAALLGLSNFEAEFFQVTEHETSIADSSPLLALLENYIGRGAPTLASFFVEKALIDNFSQLLSITNTTDEAVFSWSIDERYADLIKRAIAIIDPRIKPERSLADFNDSEPAHTLFAGLPEYLQQIIQPERFFSDGLVTEDKKGFIRQRVDFALESPGGVKWIIEVDGKQHEELDQKIRDQLRDEALYDTGWALTRIKTSDVLAWQEHLFSFLEAVEADFYLQTVIKNIQSPLWEQPEGKAILELVLSTFAVSRLQKIIVTLLRTGALNLQEKVWRIAVIERDVPAADLAFKDFILLLQNYYSLLQINDPLPQIELAIYASPEFQDQYGLVDGPENVQIVHLGTIDENMNGDFDLVIDHSMLRRYGLELILSQNSLLSTSGTRVIIRSGYRLRSFVPISTSDPITYTINKNKQEDALLFFLQNIFRKRNFRDGQLKIIKRALSRKNTIGLLPTGGGKSLCYQLVTFLQPGLTLIIDPLRSLMIDQNENLRKYRIDRSAYIISDMTPQERAIVEKRFYRGSFQFLFIAPERFQISEFRQHVQAFVSNHPIVYAVIDEAHCVSEWGHDFRTSYLLLSRTIRKYCLYKEQAPPIYALTGTASAVVLRDVQMDLGLNDSEDNRNAVVTPSTFDRPELNFYLYQCPSAQKYQMLKHVYNNVAAELGIESATLFEVNSSQTKSGLIFAPHVNSTPFSISYLRNKIGNDYSFSLTEPIKICPRCRSPLIQKTSWKNKSMSIFWGCEKFPECKYSSSIQATDEPRHFVNMHIFAGTAPDNFGETAWEKYKIKAQKEFIDNKVPLMLTTKAFGMGIDKPNIRYTIHYCLPPSIESFYQEAGRAGRDRQKAFCSLIFSDDQAKDADQRLDPNLTIDDILKLPPVHKNSEGDIHRNLFFQTTSFKGKEAENKLIIALFKVPFEIWLNQLKDGQEYIGQVHSPKISSADGKRSYESGAVEKALYRYLIIGFIEDYTVDFKSSPRVFTVKITKKADKQYAFNLYQYLSQHKADFLSIYPNIEKFLEYLRARPEEHLILQCLGELLDFIYAVIEPQRRKALGNLVEAVRPGDNQKFRSLILRYLEPNEQYNQLFWIFPQSTDLAEWITILEKAEDEETTNKLLGICLRNLESYPTSVGLRFIAASLRLSIPNEKEEYGIADFMAGLQHLKNNYAPEQIEKILSYFVFYILEKSKYAKSNLHVAKLLINEYNYGKYAIQLFQGDFEEDIRKLGAAYVLRQIKAPLSQLITYLKG